MNSSSECIWDPDVHCRTFELWRCFLFLALPSQQKPSETATQSQKTFATPKQAADALLQACDSYDVSALKQILGPRRRLGRSEDPVQDKKFALRLLQSAREEFDQCRPKNANRAVLLVGS